MNKEARVFTNVMYDNMYKGSYNTICVIIKI